MERLADIPKITVITPSLNQGMYLEETIRSVLDQKYPNLEYMVIDGGSSDNSVSIIKKYADELKFWVSEKDNGQSDAINKGMQRATGDIITWLNSDDLYLPGALNRVVGFFKEHKDISLVHGGTILFGKNKKERTITAGSNISDAQYLSTMKVAQPSSFFRKEILKDTGLLNPRLHFAMDFEMVSKAILGGHKISGDDFVYSKYRLHPGSKSSDERKFLPEWSQVVYNTLSSIHNGKKFAKIFSDLEIVKLKDADRYPCTVQFTDAELERILLEHLHLHYHHHYRFYNKALRTKINHFLKNNYPLFYKEKDFARYEKRVNFIPRFIFKMLRS